MTTCQPAVARDEPGTLDHAHAFPVYAWRGTGLRHRQSTLLRSWRIKRLTVGSAIGGWYLLQKQGKGCRKLYVSIEALLRLIGWQVREGTKTARGGHAGKAELCC
jgi:hypothetical protein